MRATDAAALARALDGLADAVCATDSRTKRQRRADALATLAEGPAQLACECGLPDCPTAIHCRDLSCRLPGCDKPAEVCDIDHTVPRHAGGPTHPSNLALLCRAHHLLKTFWSGENGWGERQYADGTIEWTSPSGRTYTTEPAGSLFFPALAEPSGEAPSRTTQASAKPGRTLMMPTRARPRAQERAARIRWERGLHEARWAADPPPF